MDFIRLGPALVACGLPLAILVFKPKSAPVARMLLAINAAFWLLRYFFWRLQFSMPPHQNWLQDVWAYLFLAVEIAWGLRILLVLFFLSRFRDRSADADRAMSSPLHQAPVDVFIATYNEGRDILERTIVGAKAIEHADLRVWVLDDGARPWVRELCQETGALYTFRVKGKHAKAGNVNHGLQVALATGRPPEFVLLLDADFVPQRNILQRTVGLFADPQVGIVQTPQHFFNPDPIQLNLMSASIWPDEQRFFFNIFLSSKDAWGAAFCCGTSAVLRVAALQACGGMATETVTEDMLTTFKMEEYGYRTIFLNEQLSMGLAPEGLQEYIAQRSRWCLGAIQQLFTRWSFFGKARISWINRLSFFDAILHWTTSALFRIMIVTAPVLYWFTGTAVVRATMPEFIWWLAPFLVSNVIFMRVYTRNYLMPFMADVTHLLTAIPICRTVIQGLLRPYGQAFKVTAKGLSTSGVTVQWNVLRPFVLFASLLVTGMVLRIPRFSSIHASPGYQLNVVWTILDSAVLMLATLVCIEVPRRRRDERFAAEQSCLVRTEHGQELPCILRDISLGGARLFSPAGWDSLGDSAELLIDDGRVVLPFTVIRQFGKELATHFNSAPEVRRTLIVELFTGKYDNEVDVVRAGKVFRRLLVSLIA